VQVLGLSIPAVRFESQGHEPTENDSLLSASQLSTTSRAEEARQRGALCVQNS
jgi:hypothetical protein